MPVKTSDLSKALEWKEIVPFFQPLVELRTGQLAGFEVLARWNHPTLKTILPGDFISVAEQSGLIDILTHTILEQSFAHPVIHDNSFTLSVNISPLQLLDFSLPERIARAAEASGFPPGRLCIEVTESALVDDPHRAASVAKELKALGCRLALDDFGTGYSSLQHLHALAFDVLKVDRTFVNSMTEKRESRKIVASVVGLGQSLGMVTVAEGVETREQANLLFAMGCDIGQGWLFGRPMPASDLTRIVAEAPAAFPVCLPISLNTNSMNVDGPPGQRLAQLQAIYDGAPVGLCLLDRKMRYVSINRRLAQMNHAPAEAHLGRTPQEIIPAVFAQIEGVIRRALAGETVTGVEIKKQAQPPDGHDRTLLGSYQPVRDEAGEVLGVSVAIMDVTEHKQMEAALRETREHYQKLVELSPHVPWVLNDKGEVTEASSRWEHYTGQPLEEALGHGWLEMLHPADVPPTQEAIRKTLETGASIDVMYRVRKPGGPWRWMRSRGAPRLSVSGEVVAVYGVVEEMDAP